MCNSTVMSPFYGSDIVLCRDQAVDNWQCFSMKATHLWVRFHNAPILPECQSESAKVLALTREQAHQDNSNDTPHLVLVGFKTLSFTEDYIKMRLA